MFRWIERAKEVSSQTMKCPEKYPEMKTPWRWMDVKRASTFHPSVPKDGTDKNGAAGAQSPFPQLGTLQVPQEPVTPSFPGSPPRAELSLTEQNGNREIYFFDRFQLLPLLNKLNEGEPRMPRIYKRVRFYWVAAQGASPRLVAMAGSFWSFRGYFLWCILGDLTVENHQYSK